MLKRYGPLRAIKTLIIEHERLHCFPDLFPDLGPRWRVFPMRTHKVWLRFVYAGDVTPVIPHFFFEDWYGDLPCLAIHNRRIWLAIRFLVYVLNFVIRHVVKYLCCVRKGAYNILRTQLPIKLYFGSLRSRL